MNPISLIDEQSWEGGVMFRETPPVHEVHRCQPEERSTVSPRKSLESETKPVLCFEAFL